MTHKPTRAELLDLTSRLQQDLRAATSKLVELRAWIAALPDEEAQGLHTCPECGLKRPTANANGHPTEQPQDSDIDFSNLLRPMP